MMEKNGVGLPPNVMAVIESHKLDKVIDVALVLEPLWENGLGAIRKRKMTRDRISELYQRM
jgi:3-deoxy-alpha-D-manno-octulosonate 8-oxidase